MAVHELTLCGHEVVAEGTWMFCFGRPPGFQFKAGQAVSLELLEPPAEPNSARRTFSLASAPAEDMLVVATRMREGSAYKRALKALPEGAKLKLRGPLGTMTLHEDASRAAVFVAGGIGITPFFSMLRQAAHEKSSRAFLLIYSNRRPEDAPFLQELLALRARLSGFRMHATMTEMDKSARSWDGPRGLLDEETVRRLVAGLPSPVYYLAGPPGMVEAMSGILKRAGASDADVRSERFFGY